MKKPRGGYRKRDNLEELKGEKRGVSHNAQKATDENRVAKGDADTRMRKLARLQPPLESAIEEHAGEKEVGVSAQGRIAAA